jgi:transposase
MRFAGIDVAAERHYVAVVDETGDVLQKPTAVSEEAAGYRQLRELLGEPEDLVAMEATGHYWRNLFAFLAAEGFRSRCSTSARAQIRRRGPSANQNRRYRRSRDCPLCRSKASGSDRFA